MRNNFLQLRAFLEQEFPEFTGSVYGDTYPPKPINILIAQLAGYLWIAGIALLFMGDSIFRALNMETPEFVRQMNNNKIGTFMALFIMNNLANGLIATGAFEVYVNEKLIFSKLETGKFPTGQQLVQTLSALGYGPKA